MLNGQPVWGHLRTQGRGRNTELPTSQKTDSSEEPNKRRWQEKKAEAESLYSLEAKIKRTEESINKLQKHLDNKTCPKSLRYSARANIPPDEQFKKDIQAVKQKAGARFSFLTR